MKIIDCIQGSPEWYQARIGIPTSSEFDKIITPKGEISKARTNYLYQLAGEFISKLPEVTYQNGDMQRGKELEAEARKLYELIKKTKVKIVGFCLEREFGCSPDGLVGKNGLLEIKCPKPSTHANYLFNWFENVPPEYYPQIQGQLLVTGRSWVDFMSYSPGMRPLIVRVYRDKKFIAILKKELENFCRELKRIVRKIK